METRTIENLCFLLWREKEIPRKEWPVYLTEWVGGKPGRGEELLRRGDPTSEEMFRLSERFNLTEEAICFSRLVEDCQIDIYQENVLYLLENLEHGEQKRIAEIAHINPNSVSRWKKREHAPRRNKVLLIAGQLGVPTHIDLAHEPLFLRWEPLLTKQKKEWLCQQIRDMDDGELDSLFPAMQRILGKK